MTTTRAPHPQQGGARTGRDRSTGRGRIAPALLVVVATLGCLALAAVLPARITASVVVGGILLVIGRGVLQRWTGLVVGLALVIMLIPMRRYAVPVPLPFALEPYRIVVVFLLGAFVVALLVDPRVQLRPLGFGGVCAAYLGASVLSVATNVGPLAEAGLATGAVGSVVGSVLLVAVFVLVRTVLVSRRQVQVLLGTLVLSGAVVGVSAVIERATSLNVFLRLGSVLPIRLLADPTTSDRVGGARALGSAGHPIALSVMLTMLVPVAFYLAKHAPLPRGGARQWVWLSCAVALVAGSVVTVSRTMVVMVLVIVLVVAALRPTLLPRVVAFAVPAGVVLLVVAPSALRGLLTSVTNPSATLEQQYASPGTRGSGRLADLGPSLQESLIHPFTGTGVGSRIVAGPRVNAQILDNQYLSTLLETGYIGLLAVLALLVVPGFSMARTARRLRRAEPGPDISHDADLAVALSASLLSYAASAFLFDAFGFPQTFFLFFLLLAVAGLLRTEHRTDSRPHHSPDHGGTLPQPAPRTHVASP